jgi:osmotically-inducible protein OsmY
MNIIAKGGSVTLAGAVTDPTQIDKATGIARSVPGVTSVKNSLILKEAGQ